MRKSIFILLALLLGAVCSQAQIIKVYKNGALESIYTSTSKCTYTVDASQGTNPSISVYKNDVLLTSYVNSGDAHYSVSFQKDPAVGQSIDIPQSTIRIKRESDYQNLFFFQVGNPALVFDRETGQCYRFVSSTEDSFADFVGNAELSSTQDYLIVLGPDEASCSEGTISCDFPAVQYVEPDGVDSKALVSVCRYDQEDNSFQSRFLGSIIKFETCLVTDGMDYACQKVEISSIDKDEAIAGNVSVGGLREYTVSNPKSKITLLPAKGDCLENGTYFASFLPFAKQGMYIDFYVTDGKVYRKEFRPTNLSRNKVYRFNQINFGNITDGSYVEEEM